MRATASTILSFALALLISHPAKAEQLSVDEAIEILETSLNKRERIDAISFLRNARERAARASDIMALIIAIDPTSSEARYAAETLGHLGTQSIPAIANLANNGFEYSYLLSYRPWWRIDPKLEKELLAAFRPLIESDSIDQRLSGILGIRGFPLSTESANALCRVLLSKRYRGSEHAVALYIAPKGNAEDIPLAIKKNASKTMKYIAARLEEEWVWRDSPIYKRIWISHAPKELPESEVERKNEAESVLVDLAKEAVPEAIEHLRDSRISPVAHVVYLWIETLKYLSVHAALPKEEVIRALDEIERPNGSNLDHAILKYRYHLTKSRNDSVRIP
jgi:hypothetical protein